MKKMAYAIVASVAVAMSGIQVAKADCNLFGNIGGGCCDSTPLCLSETGCDESGCDSLSECDACGFCGERGLKCGCLGDLNLLGFIKPSDRCFDDFISPMIDFVHFEDPRTLTEIRPMFVNHRFPGTLGPANIPAGGSAQLFAMQFRIALTDRLSLIAVKDGYIIDNSEGTLDTLLDSGFADVTAGLKYNLIRNVETGTLGSIGFTYEIPMGSEQALQALGDGQFHFFATGGQRLAGGNAHYLTSFGYQVPVDTSIQTSAIQWHNHFDVKLTKKTYLLTEMSWWHWVDDASAGQALGVAGLDLLNLNANNVSGNDVVSQNVGLKYKPNRKVEAGVAYEFPLTGFEDIMRDRLQVECIFRS